MGLSYNRRCGLARTGQLKQHFFNKQMALENGKCQIVRFGHVLIVSEDILPVVVIRHSVQAAFGFFGLSAFVILIRDQLANMLSFVSFNQHAEHFHQRSQ